MTNIPLANLFAIMLANELMNDEDHEEIVENVVNELVHDSTLNTNQVLPATIQDLNNLNVQSVELSGHKGKTCSICLDKLEENEFCACLPCTHVFHRGCVFAWLLQADSCPICRRSISSGTEMKNDTQNN